MLNPQTNNPQRNDPFLTASHKEAKASFPLPLTGPYRLEGATLATPGLR